MGAPAQLQTDLGDLGGLARAGLTGNDHYLVGCDGLTDLLATFGNRQLIVKAHGWNAVTTRLHPRAGALELLQPAGPALWVRLFTQLLQLALQAMAIGGHGLIEVACQRG